MSFFRSRFFIYLLAACVLGLFIWYGESLEDNQVVDLTSPNEANESVAAKVTGAPKIGGPFSLVNQKGMPVTDQIFRGRYMLVYFGYTFCPDVCPTSLSIIADALDMLEPKELEKIVPIFITVDPERDTPEVMKEYVPNFHSKLVGLTGTKDQVYAAAKAYRAYFKKVVEEGGDEDAYLMDHTSITYLMGPDGQFVKHFPHGYDPQKMAERLKAILAGKEG